MPQAFAPAVRVRTPDKPDQNRPARSPSHTPHPATTSTDRLTTYANVALFPSLYDNQRKPRENQSITLGLLRSYLSV